MTFFEWLTIHCLGPPAFKSGGRLYYHCPFHNDDTPSFCTMPPHPHYKDRCVCFGCGWFGDEYDLLRVKYPYLNYPQLRMTLDELKMKHSRKNTDDTSSPGGQGHAMSDLEAIIAVQQFLADQFQKRCSATQRRISSEMDRSAHLLTAILVKAVVQNPDFSEMSHLSIAEAMVRCSIAFWEPGEQLDHMCHIAHHLHEMIDCVAHALNDSYDSQSLREYRDRNELSDNFV